MFLSVMSYDQIVVICLLLNYPVGLNLCLSYILLVLFLFDDLDCQMYVVLQFVYLKEVGISSFFSVHFQLFNLSYSDTSLIIISIFQYHICVFLHF